LAATAAVTIAGTKPATWHRTTVFGDVPVSDMKPEWTAETMPDHFPPHAGIQVGDIITEVAGQPATSFETLIALAPRSVPATLCHMRSQRHDRHTRQPTMSQQSES
jgi:hypothetical protein